MTAVRAAHRDRRDPGRRAAAPARRSEREAGDRGDLSLDFTAHAERPWPETASGEKAMHDSALAQVAALPEKIDGRAEAAVARALRSRAAALQPAVPGQASRLPHPGTGLRRAVGAGRGEAEGAGRGGGSAAEGQAAGAQGRPADQRHAADPRVAGRRAHRHRARRRLRVPGPAIQVAVRRRARDHRHALERPAVLGLRNHRSGK